MIECGGAVQMEVYDAAVKGIVDEKSVLLIILVVVAVIRSLRRIVNLRPVLAVILRVSAIALVLIVPHGDGCAGAAPAAAAEGIAVQREVLVINVTGICAVTRERIIRILILVVIKAAEMSMDSYFRSLKRASLKSDDRLHSQGSDVAATVLERIESPLAQLIIVSDIQLAVPHFGSQIALWIDLALIISCNADEIIRLRRSPRLHFRAEARIELIPYVSFGIIGVVIIGADVLRLRIGPCHLIVIFGKCLLIAEGRHALLFSVHGENRRHVRLGKAVLAAAGIESPKEFKIAGDLLALLNLVFVREGIRIG